MAIFKSSPLATADKARPELFFGMRFYLRKTGAFSERELLAWHENPFSRKIF